MRFARWALVVVVLGGCDGLLEVDDGSILDDGDIRDPAAAPLLVNGAERSVQEGWDGVLLLLSTVSDELTWVGPHSWWGELNSGNISSPQNTGLEQSYAPAAAATWYSREVTEVLDSLDAVGEAVASADRSRAYLYSSIALAAVADALEDFAPSDRGMAGPAIGPDAMGVLYDRAVDDADRGIDLAAGDSASFEVLGHLWASRARALHGLEVWERLRPPPADTSRGGLVEAGDAAAAALKALEIGPDDWRLEFVFTQAADLPSQTGVEMCGGLRNLAPGPAYAATSPPALGVDSVVIRDPIDSIPDPSVAAVLAELTRPGCFFVSLTVTSAREMHLIVAEDALARADTTTFAVHVNTVRTREGLSPWSPASSVTARDLLIHERRTRLFMTGRRLADMYRFGTLSDSWLPASIVVTEPGSLFPIPTSEVEANCYLNGSCG